MPINKYLYVQRLVFDLPVTKEPSKKLVFPLLFTLTSSLLFIIICNTYFLVCFIYFSFLGMLFPLELHVKVHRKTTLIYYAAVQDVGIINVQCCYKVFEYEDINN